MGMTKKDYEMLAHWAGAHQGVSMGAVEALMDRLADDNPRFNKDTFREAVHQAHRSVMMGEPQS